MFSEISHADQYCSPFSFWYFLIVDFPLEICVFFCYSFHFSLVSIWLAFRQVEQIETPQNITYRHTKYFRFVRNDSNTLIVSSYISLLMILIVRYYSYGAIACESNDFPNIFFSCFFFLLCAVIFAMFCSWPGDRCCFRLMNLLLLVYIGWTIAWE